MPNPFQIVSDPDYQAMPFENRQKLFNSLMDEDEDAKLIDENQRNAMRTEFESGIEGVAWQPEPQPETPQLPSDI